MLESVANIKDQMSIDRQKHQITFPGNIAISPSTKRSEFENNYSQYVSYKSRASYNINQPDLGYAMTVHFYDELIMDVSFVISCKNIKYDSTIEFGIKYKEIHDTLLRNLLNDPDFEWNGAETYDLKWVKILSIYDTAHGNGPSIKFQFRQLEDLSPHEKHIAENAGRIPDRYNPTLRKIARSDITFGNKIASIIYENGTIGIRMENPIKEETIQQILKEHAGHNIVRYTSEPPKAGYGYICKTSKDFIEYVEKL